MVVRLGTEKDFNQVMELLKEFHAESLDKYGILMNDGIAMCAMQRFLGTSFVLEIDGHIVGVLGGTVVTYPLNDELMYQEWVWFVSRRNRLHGIRLYFKLVEYCKEHNIKKILMVHMGNSKADKLERFYTKLGFELLEKHYVKDLGGVNAKS